PIGPLNRASISPFAAFRPRTSPAMKITISNREGSANRVAYARAAAIEAHSSCEKSLNTCCRNSLMVVSIEATSSVSIAFTVRPLDQIKSAQRVWDEGRRTRRYEESPVWSDFPLFANDTGGAHGKAEEPARPSNRH